MNKKLLFFVLVLLPAFTFAKDYGVQGHVFPIIEENLKEFLQKRLKTLPEEEIKEKLSFAAKNPKPLYLSEARIKRSFFFDPTYVVPETIKGSKGEIIARKGERINPLSSLELDEGLLFFDGSNLKHIDWAESHREKFLWILVKGSPVKLEEEKERFVYFDQGGVLCAKFGVKSIPCRITQNGSKLLVEEISLKKELKH